MGVETQEAGEGSKTDAESRRSESERDAKRPMALLVSLYVGKGSCSRRIIADAMCTDTSLIKLRQVGNSSLPLHRTKKVLDT